MDGRRARAALGGAPLTLVHVSTRREWRGGEQQLWHLAAGTGAAVACPPDGALARRLPPELVAPVAFRGAVWGGGALRAVVSARRPAALAVHDANGLRAALSCGVGVVAHRRVDFVPSWFGARRLRACAGVVAVSEAVRRVLAGVGVHRVVVVRDGVEVPAGEADRAGVRASLGLPPDALLLVAVGALVPHKGHATLVRALPLLPGIHAVVLGEGSGRVRLAAEAASAGVAARLHLPGFQADVGRWLRSADAVVHPSREEGLGQVVLEAVGAGARVVVSDAGGLPELEGPVARFPAGDAAALAQATRRALAAPAPLPRPVRAVGDMVTETLDAYRELLAHPSSRSR